MWNQVVSVAFLRGVFEVDAMGTFSMIRGVPCKNITAQAAITIHSLYFVFKEKPRLNRVVAGLPGS